VRTCAGIKANGERCSNRAAGGSEWCSAHDPARKEARHAAAVAGGKARHGGGRGEVSALKKRLREIAERVILDPDDPRYLHPKAGAVYGQLVNVQLRAVEVSRKIEEQEDLLARLEALEVLEEQQDGSRRAG
jgi:hypothetical protein